MVLVYLPTKLGDFVRGNVGIHIPAPWVAYGTNIPRFNNRSLKWLDQSTSALPLSALESSHMRLHPKNISLVALIPYRKSEKQKKTWAIPYTWKNHLQMGVLIMFFFFLSLEIQSKCRMVFCRPRPWFRNVIFEPPIILELSGMRSQRALEERVPSEFDADAAYLL